MPIKITVAGLADYMTSGPARQRTILRNFKFPKLKNGKPIPQIVRYSEARAAVAKYHEQGNDPTVLLNAVQALTKKIADHPEKDAARINDNIRALKQYMKAFGGRKFEIQEATRPKYMKGEVIISTSPDLFVKENGQNKLVKLDFSKKPPKQQAVDILLKVMHEAGSAAALGVKAKDVLYLDVDSGTEITGGKLNVKLKKDIDAACDTIEAVWPTIQR